ncbi:Putative disease resistance protein RGA1 [Morus notabilis]|uniref:Putative disease resistance protein RGA1 n=1 Tax=Morus notabilis TaxID=981085 RepID=W9R4H2_9ROSA|nr:putative disease resistance protein RGA1 [Morus notabilis]EXB68165.1 Putative disease resistance protein RGA1 [Morus notabilis]
MAERNLTIVADHILEHLRSEDEKIGSLRRIVLPELLQGFKGTVSTLKPLLLDAEKKSFGDEGLKHWLLRLGDLLFDADNLLEEIRLYSLYAAANSPKTTCKQLAGLLLKQVRRFVLISTSSNYVVPRFKIINESLERIAAERNEFNLEKLSEDIQLPVAEVALETSTAPSSKVGREIFARSKDKEEIVRILLDADAGLIGRDYAKVLPIYGQAGLGRTSLAKDAFHDERVRRRFDRQMWVRVSKNMDVKEILKEMVASATSGSIENLHDLPESQLAAQLQDSLQGKRCLSVLEDESDEPSNKWPQLEYRVLQVGARGSAIILITSSRWFAEIAGNVKPFCSEGRLNYKKYHRTYFEKANSKGSTLFHKELTTIGDEILRQCHGHPLLFSAIGSMLSSDYKEQVWRSFYENELLRTLECYVRDARFRDCQLLKLSYNHLPFRLQHCFAYCSLFPRGHEIDVRMLIKLWMAQGFIDPKDSTQSLEQVGYKYFMNLLSRSFFYEVAVDVSGRVTKCKMHNLMHDLATYVAGEQCRLLNSRSAVDTRASHLSFGADLSFDEHVPASLKSAKKLRSILLPTKLRRKDREAPDEGIFYTLISNCRFLRVLDLHALGIKKVPISIGKLYHLRYLDLSENEYITKLPDSITELLNLQTLRLSSCFKLKKLPRDIGKLINLRHLELDGCYSLVSLPRGIGKLTNLQTLSQLVLSEDASTRNNELEQLKGLNNLTEDFEIKNLKHGKDDMAATYFAVIRQKVRSLSLEWESHAPESDDNDTQLNAKLFSDLEKLSLNGVRGGTLFSCFFPNNLVKLSLRRCAKCFVLPAISQCHKLKVLALDEMTDLEYVDNTGVSSQGEFFPDLQELWLTELPKLQGWWKPSSVSQEYLPSFPRLSKLVVEDCPKLDSMPLFPTLEDGLVLDSTCWNPFQLTMKHRAAATKNKVSSSTSSQSTPLSKLKKLCIVGIPEFDDSKANEVEWHNLKSLQLLKFDSLPGLTTLPEGLKPATNQAEGGKPAGTNQPEGGKPATNLQELHVWRCGLRELPAWIDKLELLEKLVIRACPMMGTLPGEIRGLKYLKTVEIDDCPMLQRRCEEGIGADWDKISHIETRQVRRISGS